MFEWVLRDIRNGLELPDHFADHGDEAEEAAEESTSSRWWEDEGLTLADFPPLSGETRQARREAR